MLLLRYVITLYRREKVCCCCQEGNCSYPTKGMRVELPCHVPSFELGWNFLRKIAGILGRRKSVGFPVGTENLSDGDDVISAAL